MSKILKKLSDALSKLKNETVHQLDLFGQLPSFTVLNKSRYTSNFGFVLSLIIGCLALYYLNSEISSMTLKLMPSIYQSEIQVVETDPYLLTNSNFTLAVSIASQFSEPTKGVNKYYQLNISQCTRERKIDEKTDHTIVLLDCKEIPIETCNMSHFSTELQQKYFSTIRFGTVQCINREYLKNNPLILQGQFNALTYKYLLIKFTPCRNTTEYQGCAPQEEINKILEAGQYNVYKSDYLTQFEQSGNPYQQIITNEFTSFSLTTSKTIVHTYRIMQTQTDQGLILEENQLDTNLQQTEWREISDFYNNQYLVCHYIKLDFKQTNIKRTYIKLQTILAKIGGILQILTMIVGIFLKPIIENFMKFEIASQLFSYNDNQQEQFISSGQVLSEREIQSPSSLQKLSTFFQSNENIQSNVKQKQASCLQIFLIIFGINKVKHKQFCKAKRKIIKNLDIVTILKKLQDLEVIKKILFTQEQLEQLKKRPRPKLWIKKQDSIIEQDRPKPEIGFHQSNLYSSQYSDVTAQTLFKSYITSQFQQYFNHVQQGQQDPREFEQQQQKQQTNTDFLQDKDDNIKSSQMNINNEKDQSPELQVIEKKINLEIKVQQ
ncbi:unnamed protein product (macronuclear) [Paramecium tetraurelia]|uniref:Transmembrane protein n=1 Tax=Paramecium tetraurelia TaxID=5888 RepID=A0EA50_PARTE|nr:uncharacterized protein GSPATT00024899001 [Paramecium tetraurelia]CAK92167.1 unnamed protein product [Paramecium tetraurelia]|eukprot:XP_001459564.1 hypothetical protein (macronuclear) [Paramecium tetraurelia strain d4-2]